MTVNQAPYRVRGKECLAPGVFLLHFDRNGLQFETGQYLSLGVPGQRKEREYSIYSGTEDEFLSVLIKEIPTGLMSPQLVALNEGDVLHVSGPYGYFLLSPSINARVPLLWLATGTGISPFHSFVRTFPDAPYRLLHGTRTIQETAMSDGFSSDRVDRCVSGETGFSFHGRVTKKLATMELDPKTHVFLCGNCDMIYDAFDLLQAKGIRSDQIFTEEYY